MGTINPQKQEDEVPQSQKALSKTVGALRVKTFKRIEPFTSFDL